MTRKIWISSVLALAAAMLVLAPATAFAGSPLLSGYGGPGAGEQAIIGSTLIGGSGGGGAPADRRLGRLDRVGRREPLRLGGSVGERQRLGRPRQARDRLADRSRRRTCRLGLARGTYCQGRRRSSRGPARASKQSSGGVGGAASAYVYSTSRAPSQAPPPWPAYRAAMCSYWLGSSPRLRWWRCSPCGFPGYRANAERPIDLTGRPLEPSPPWRSHARHPPRSR